MRALADAITAAVTDPALRRRAAVLGEQIRSEDGVACAVDVFHRYFPAPERLPVWARPFGRRDKREYPPRRRMHLLPQEVAAPS